MTSIKKTMQGLIAQWQVNLLAIFFSDYWEFDLSKKQ